MLFLDFKTADVRDPSLKRAIDFIKNLSSDIECRQHEIEPGLIANVFEYETADGGNFEAHRKYIDVQCVISGEETVDWAHRDDLEIHTPYQEADDYLLFHPDDSVTEKFRLIPGKLMVLYPEDAHRPKQLSGQSRKVKKIVAKVPVAG
jgi:biofilm protein TabA